MEIERKFLVSQLPSGLETHPRERISQGYLLPQGTPQDLEVRVRRKGDACYLTVKHGQGLQRTEVELPLTPADFDALWPLTEGRRLQKTRFRLPHDTETIELDVYSGPLDGFHTAEVEFPSVEASTAFQPPTFFGREVTDEPAYRNASLARHGWPAQH